MGNKEEVIDEVLSVKLKCKTNKGNTVCIIIKGIHDGEMELTKTSHMNNVSKIAEIKLSYDIFELHYIS